MSSSTSKLEMAKTILSTIGSVAATAMVVRTVAQDYLPHELQHYLSFGISSFLNRFSSDITMVIDEFDGLVNNEIYEAAQLYLGTKASPHTHRLKVSKPEKDHAITVAIERNEEVSDLFDGAKFKWVLVCQRVESKNFYNPRDTNSTLRSEVRSFELTFHRKHKDKVLNSYLPYILNEAKSVQRQKKTVKIFTVNNECMYSNFGDAWNEVNLDHPATFETLAMDLKLKETIVKDLDRFVKRREFYRKVGKAWKRGYFLYGPPGTGKSSLIAAMANYLNFDIYDLELTDIRCNSDLRRLLLGTANRSILVVEDIDCTIEFKDRVAAEAVASNPDGFHQEENKVTLSGLLNFVDGLWSSCGDERIIVFTTNHIEKLDPALLRPGRMDFHVHMSYCTPCGFRLLAANYLDIKEHELFEDIEIMIESTEVTPAEVAEQLLKGDDPDSGLAGLIDFMREKRKQNEEAKAKKLVEAVVEAVEKQGQSEQQNGSDKNEEAKAKKLVEAVVESVEKQSQSEQQNGGLKIEEKQN